MFGVMPGTVLSGLPNRKVTLPEATPLRHPPLSVIHLSPSSSFLSVILALDPRTQDGRDFTP